MARGVPAIPQSNLAWQAHTNIERPARRVVLQTASRQDEECAGLQQHAAEWPMKITRRAAGLALVSSLGACISAPVSAPPAEKILDARLIALTRFLGRWRGTVEGEPGTGTVERTYTPVLSGKFVEERNESRYRSGEVHHHLAYWSLDRRRGRFVLRQFHQESFVNQFVATTADFAEGVLVMESESIENIPPGFRARETYRFGSADAFEEIFEIAEPNGAFQPYSHNRFTRA